MLASNVHSKNIFLFPLISNWSTHHSITYLRTYPNEWSIGYCYHNWHQRFDQYYFFLLAVCAKGIWLFVMYVFVELQNTFKTSSWNPWTCVENITCDPPYPKPQLFNQVYSNWRDPWKFHSFACMQNLIGFINWFFLFTKVFELQED